jgi:hypothetical protein
MVQKAQLVMPTHNLPKILSMHRENIFTFSLKALVKGILSRDGG